MALDLAPTALFPSWSFDGATIHLARTDLFELTAAACDPEVGDGRAVLLAIMKTVFERYNEMVDRPAALSMRYEPGRFVTGSTDAFFEKVEARFRLTFYVVFPEETIAGEPL